MKIIESRDVDFFELIFPLKDGTSGNVDSSAIETTIEDKLWRMSWDSEDEDGDDERAALPKGVGVVESSVQQSDHQDGSDVHHRTPPLPPPDDSWDTSGNATAELRRSTRLRQKPDRYGKFVANMATATRKGPSRKKETTSAVTRLPRTSEAPADPEWRQSMQEELNALEVHDTAELVDLPVGGKALPSHWVFALK